MDIRSISSSIINSFLGPNKSNKIIINEEDNLILRCPLSIFQVIRFEDPISSLVEETLHAHHELHGCSTLSLLAMWYFWYEEFLLVLKEGYKIQDIIMNSQMTLKDIASVLINICVNTNSLFIYKEAEVDKTLNKVLSVIRFSSRHFSPLQNLVKLDDEAYRERNQKLEEHCLLDIVNKLDHDEVSGIASLVFECWREQLVNCSGFKTDGLLVCPIILPCSSSTVLSGLVLKNKCNPVSYKDKKSPHKNRVLIIKGSVTYEYVHLGFSPKVSMSLQKTSHSLLKTEKDAWKEKCCQLILDLGINILLVKEDIDPEISNFCQAHSILALPYIPQHVLKILCNSLQYSPSTYILDCNKEMVIENLAIHEWKSDGISVLKDQYFVINLSTKSMVQMQTIILCHPSEIILKNMEHQLQHLLSRLNSALINNKLLPGGAKTEEWCCIYLEKLLCNKNLNDSKKRIITAMKNGFKDYSDMISKKWDMCNCTNKFDDMSSKLSAWYSALSLVLMTVQCDTALLNGVDSAQL